MRGKTPDGYSYVIAGSRTFIWHMKFCYHLGLKHLYQLNDVCVYVYVLHITLQSAFLPECIYSCDSWLALVTCL